MCNFPLARRGRGGDDDRVNPNVRSPCERVIASLVVALVVGLSDGWAALGEAVSKVPLEVELTIQGRVAGRSTLPPGSPFEVVEQDGERVKLRHRAGEIWAEAHEVDITWHERDVPPEVEAPAVDMHAGAPEEEPEAEADLTMASEPGEKPGPAASAEFDERDNAAKLKGRVDFPRGSFHADYLEAAMAKAAAEDKHVAFIYTRNDSTCPLTHNAAGIMVRGLRSSSVLVYAPSTSGLPPQVVAAIRGRGSKYIPAAIVFDADLANALGTVTYEDVKAGGDRAVRQLRRNL